MKPLAAILAAALAIGLCGCVAGAKSAAKTPAPPTVAAAPQQLSLPQTEVELPRAQPLNREALATAAPPAVEAPPPPPKPEVKDPAPKGSKGGTPRTVTQPKPEPVTPPAVVVETPRPPIQEIVPQAEADRLQKSAQEHKRQVAALLNQASSRRLSKEQQGMVTRVKQFVTLSDDAEKANDMRAADDLANRAHLLAKELSGGK